MSDIPQEIKDMVAAAGFNVNGSGGGSHPLDGNPLALDAAKGDMVIAAAATENPAIQNAVYQIMGHSAGNGRDQSATIGI